MTEHQKIHIAMLNSYNVLTGKANAIDIMNSDVPFFSHDITGEANIDSVNYIIYYFTSLEMYEQCSLLQAFIDETFDDDGNAKEVSCQCDYPTIGKYSIKTTCGTCGRKMRP